MADRGFLISVQECVAEMRKEPVKTMGATEQVKLAAEHTRMVLEAFEKGIISKGEALD